MNKYLLSIMVLFLVNFCSEPAFSSCMSLDELLNGKNAVLVEIVKLHDLEKVKQVAEMKKGEELVNISSLAEVKVLKVYKGSDTLVEVKTAVVKLICYGDKYKGGDSTVGPLDCHTIGKGSYPFIVGQRFLLFTDVTDNNGELSLSVGPSCGLGLTWCVESGKGVKGCGALEELEKGLSKY